VVVCWFHYLSLFGYFVGLVCRAYVNLLCLGALLGWCVCVLSYMSVCVVVW